MAAWVLLSALGACDTDGIGRPVSETSASITAPIAAIDAPQPRGDEDLVAVILVPSASSDDGAVTHISAWYRDDVAVEELDGSDQVPAEMTTPGEEWRLEVRGVQGDLLSEPGVDAVTIENTPPTVTATLSPAAPSSADDLIVSVETSDADGDIPSVRYTWYRDAALEAGETADTLPSDSTERGDEWYCHVEVTDAQGATADVWLGTFIENTPPTILGAIVTPQPAYSTDSLNCEPVGFDDPDGDEPAYSYQWTVDRGADGTCNCHAAEPEPLLDSSFVSRGYLISCEITPSDGDASTATVHSDAVEILNSAPTTPEIGISPAAPVTGDTLFLDIITPSADPDDDPISTEVTWTVDGVDWGSGDIVPGDEVVAGQDWAVTAIAADDADAAEPATASVTISAP